MTSSQPPQIHPDNDALREEFCRRVDIIRRAQAIDPSLIMTCQVRDGAEAPTGLPDDIRALLSITNGAWFGVYSFSEAERITQQQYIVEWTPLLSGSVRIGGRVDTPLMYRDGRVFTFDNPDLIEDPENVVDLGPFWELLVKCVGPGYAPEPRDRDDWWDVMGRLGLLD
jgi:hypothetical protein